MRIDLGEKENLEPNMAPLLDCIFLLLIFFLVATTFDKNEDKSKEKIEQLNITLPDSSAAFAPIEIKLNPLVIGIDRKGRYFLNNRRVKITKLHQMLTEQAQNDPERRIRIDGDARTPLQHIVHLLDICELQGLHNIGVRTHGN